MSRYVAPLSAAMVLWVVPSIALGASVRIDFFGTVGSPLSIVGDVPAGVSLGDPIEGYVIVDDTNRRPPETPEDFAYAVTSLVVNLGPDRLEATGPAIGTLSLALSTAPTQVWGLSFNSFQFPNALVPTVYEPRYNGILADPTAQGTSNASIAASNTISLVVFPPVNLAEVTPALLPILPATSEFLSFTTRLPDGGVVMVRGDLESLSASVVPEARIGVLLTIALFGIGVRRVSQTAARGCRMGRSRRWWIGRCRQASSGDTL